MKFRRLHYLDVQSIQTANLIIAASCTLHNFIMMNGDRNNMNLLNVGPDNDDNNDNIDTDAID